MGQAVAAWTAGLDAVIADVSRSLTALRGRARPALARRQKAWQRRAERWLARAEDARLRVAKSATARALAAPLRPAQALLARSRKTWILAAKPHAATPSPSHHAL